MYCIECGTELPNEANFCSTCGKKQVRIDFSKGFREGPRLNSTEKEERFSFSRSNENYDRDVYSDLVEFLKEEGYGDIPIPNLDWDSDSWTHKMVEPGSGCGWNAYVCHPITIYCNTDLPFSYDLTVYNEKHPAHDSVWTDAISWFKPHQLKDD